MKYCSAAVFSHFRTLSDTFDASVISPFRRQREAECFIIYRRQPRHDLSRITIQAASRSKPQRSLNCGSVYNAKSVFDTEIRILIKRSDPYRNSIGIGYIRYKSDMRSGSARSNHLHHTYKVGGGYFAILVDIGEFSLDILTVCCDILHKTNS